MSIRYSAFHVPNLLKQMYNQVILQSIFTSRFCSNESISKCSIEIGQTCELRRTFSTEDVALFAKVTGDHNPLHFDDSFARKVNFSKAIVHGALINGVISAAIGTLLPGPGSILLEQDLHFPNPLYAGEQFITKITIANKKRNIYFCQYECKTTADDKKVVYGMAKILFQHSKLAQ